MGTIEFQGQTWDVVEWTRTHQGIVLRAYGPRPQFLPGDRVWDTFTRQWVSVVRWCDRDAVRIRTDNGLEYLVNPGRLSGTVPVPAPVPAAKSVPRFQPGDRVKYHGVLGKVVNPRSSSPEIVLDGSWGSFTVDPDELELLPRFQVGDWVLRYDNPCRVEGLVDPETIRLSYGTRYTVLAPASKCTPYQSRRGPYRLVGFRGADLLVEDDRSPMIRYTFTRAEWEAL